MSLFEQVRGILRQGGIEDAALEAKFLLEDIKDPQEALTAAKRRAAREPLQYLLGTWEFYGLTLAIGEGVLIPRQDTETLADCAIAYAKDEDAPKILDLCAGSGCIALALQKHLPRAEITGIEKSGAAAAYAVRNAEKLGLPVKFLTGDVLEERTAAGFRDISLIVCNPPYLSAEDMKHLQPEVAHEPEMALFGGEDGLFFYRKITPLWADTLRSGGCLMFEIGCTQGGAVREILSRNGFGSIQTRKDLGGHDRVVFAIKP